VGRSLIAAIAVLGLASAGCGGGVLSEQQVRDAITSAGYPVHLKATDQGGSGGSGEVVAATVRDGERWAQILVASDADPKAAQESVNWRSLPAHAIAWGGSAGENDLFLWAEQDALSPRAFWAIADALCRERLDPKSCEGI
jgi:hypothetical protein